MLSLIDDALCYVETELRVTEYNSYLKAKCDSLKPNSVPMLNAF